MFFFSYRFFSGPTPPTPDFHCPDLLPSDPNYLPLTLFAEPSATNNTNFIKVKPVNFDLAVDSFKRLLNFSIFGYY